MPRRPWLLIADVCKGQWTNPVKDLVRQSNGKMSAIPNNWTNYFQPLDLSVNKPWVTKFYDYIRSKPEIVRHGWEKLKITECVKEKMKLDPFADV